MRVFVRMWCHLFMVSWNGVAKMPEDHPQRHFYSGSFGCGSLWGEQWLQLPWAEETSIKSIACKELIPVVMA